VQVDELELQLQRRRQSFEDLPASWDDFLPDAIAGDKA
jgi:hypothetical protein